MKNIVCLLFTAKKAFKEYGTSRNVHRRAFSLVAYIYPFSLEAAIIKMSNLLNIKALNSLGAKMRVRILLGPRKTAVWTFILAAELSAF